MNFSFSLKTTNKLFFFSRTNFSLATLIAFFILLGHTLPASAQTKQKKSAAETAQEITDSVENFDDADEDISGDESGDEDSADEEGTEDAVATDTKSEEPELPVLKKEKNPPQVRMAPANTANILKEEATELDQAPVPQIKKKKDRIDPQFRQGVRYIEHPNSAKGLIRIDKERNYIYKVKTTDQSKAVSVRFGTYEPTKLTSPNNSTLTYDTLYSEESMPMILYDQEFQFAQGFGKLGWKWGTGLKMAKGHGAFEDGRGDEPPEEFTLFIFPFNLGAVYRFQFWDGQLIVPYVEGGADGFCFAEHRDDNQNPKWGAALGFAPAAHASAGGAIQLGSGSRSFLDLDREYGINSVWIEAEYRYYFALSNKYDFSGDSITAGIHAEY